MRSNNILILVVAIVLGGIAAFLARNWLLSQTQASRSVEGRIVVATKAMPFGTPLSDDNVVEIAWGGRDLPDGAFASRQELFKDGRRAMLATVTRNEPILSSKITGPGQQASLSSTIEDGKRAVTVRVDDVRGVAGFILPNDHVDVVLIRSANNPARRESYSDLLLQNVKVIAIDQVAAEQKERPSVAKAVTLEVTPSQAQQIALATEIGTLSLILRQAGEADVVRNDRVTESDLGEGDSARKNRKSPVGSVVSAQRPTELSSVPSIDLSTVSVYVVRDINKDVEGQKYTVTREGR
jgi:pilus assembly protein CpaB